MVAQPSTGEVLTNESENHQIGLDNVLPPKPPDARKLPVLVHPTLIYRDAFYFGHFEAYKQYVSILFQDSEIFYEVCKDIHQGTELLVWYGDSYLQFMGIPVALKNTGTPPPSEEPEGEEMKVKRKWKW